MPGKSSWSLICSCESNPNPAVALEGANVTLRKSDGEEAQLTCDVSSVRGAGGSVDKALALALALALASPSPRPRPRTSPRPRPSTSPSRKTN